MRNVTLDRSASRRTPVFPLELAVVAAGLLLLAGTPAHAQRSRFSPERIFGFLDRNKDGQLAGEEMERLPGSLRDWLDRNDYHSSSPLSKADFIRLAPEMFQAMRQAREARESSYGPPSSGPPAGDASRSTSLTNRRVDGSGPDAASPTAGRFGASAAGTSTTALSSTASPGTASGSTAGSGAYARSAGSSPAFQFARQLPEQWQPLDRDGDRQIGLYEWDRTKRPEFFRRDLNNDGFLTPRELHSSVVSGSQAAPAVAVTSSAAAGSSTPGASPASGAGASTDQATATGSSPMTGSTTNQPAATTVAATPASAPAASETAETLDPRKARTAAYFFGLMDRNRDGQLTEDEWGRSRRIGPKFRDAGIDLSQPMSKEAFVPAYARLFLN